MFDKFRIKITIFASLIITLFCYLKDINFLKTCYSIISTIIVFYFIGSLIELKIKEYLEKKLALNELETQDLEQTNLEDFKENENNFSDNLEENFILDKHKESLEENDFYDINFEEE